MTRKFIEDSLIIASHNLNKIYEIKTLLNDLHIKAISAAELNLPIPEETGTTYLENALLKAQACTKITNKPTLSDDSGVEVAGLMGAPGVDTAPYTQINGGREKVFAMWQQEQSIIDNPKATFVCIQVLAWPDGHYEYAEGRIEGKLTFPPRGQGGHGYDPVFIPDGYDCTVAEMSFTQKNLCSHRFLAFKNLMNKCLVNQSKNHCQQSF